MDERRCQVNPRTEQGQAAKRAKVIRRIRAIARAYLRERGVADSSPIDTVGEAIVLLVISRAIVSELRGPREPCYPLYPGVGELPHLLSAYLEESTDWHYDHMAEPMRWAPWEETTVGRAILAARQAAEPAPPPA